MKRFLFFLLFFILSMLPFAASAEDYTALVREAEQNKYQAILPFLRMALVAKKNAMNSLQDKITPIQRRNRGPEVIVFISFAMPEQSIISYLRDARILHASLVIRGLIHNSFKDTFLKMAKIVKAAGSGGIELNPLVFKKFHIKTVPAVVVLPESDSCLSQKVCLDDQYDVVYGDIPLLDALKTIRDHGSVAKSVADQLILNSKDSLHA